MLTINHDAACEEAMDGPPGALALLPADRSTDGRATLVRAARPGAGFVAHLIATAEQLPQTRHLRRATTTDAHSAYAAKLQPTAAVGGKTRQMI